MDEGSFILNAAARKVRWIVPASALLLIAFSLFFRTEGESVAFEQEPVVAQIPTPVFSVEELLDFSPVPPVLPPGHDPVFQLPDAPSVTEKKAPWVPARIRRVQRALHPVIVREAQEHGLDPSLVKAIILAESGYNPKAVSSRGAKGLMQLMPGTARSLGVVDVFDPRHNIRGGVKYFKELLERFGGDLKLALAAYNAGTRKVLKYRGIPPFQSTHAYVQKVLDYYEYFKSRERSESA